MLYAQEDLRIEEREIGEMGPRQVLVRVGAGGVCGSDIHYYWEGGIGTIRVTEPIVMGHEAAGTVEAVGAEVTSVRPGERIAISPSRPCDHCNSVFPASSSTASTCSFSVAPCANRIVTVLSVAT